MIQNFYDKNGNKIKECVSRRFLGEGSADSNLWNYDGEGKLIHEFLNFYWNPNFWQHDEHPHQAVYKYSDNELEEKMEYNETEIKLKFSDSAKSVYTYAYENGKMVRAQIAYYKIKNGIVIPDGTSRISYGYNPEREIKSEEFNDQDNANQYRKVYVYE